MPSDPPLRPGSAGVQHSPRWHLLKAHVVGAGEDGAGGEAALALLQVGGWVWLCVCEGRGGGVNGWMDGGPRSHVWTYRVIQQAPPESVPPWV